MTSTQPNHDPTMAHVAPAAPQPPPPQGPPQPGVPGEFGPNLIAGLGSQQVMDLLKQLPGFKATDFGKDSASVAAETLSNLSQATFQGQPHPQHIPHPAYHHHVVHPHQHPGLAGDPGPSSHPRGPPNLGQLSAAATALQGPPGAPSVGQPSGMRTRSHDGEDMPPEGDDSGAMGALDGSGGEGDGGEGGDKAGGGKGSGGRRGGRSATMSNDEWTRQRKDNHKEVERRRRGNINEGINELGRIVPNGSGEKAKGAILSRAVQYIHHLKENEARNIEKWTLEKLLMDQAMGDLQAQLEEMRRLWEDERLARQRAESELEVLRGLQQGLPVASAVAAAVANVKPGDQSRTPEGAKENGKRDRPEAEGLENGLPGTNESAEEAERAKRQRVE